MSGMNRYAEANGEYLIQFEDGLDQYGELYKIPTALFAENRQRLVDALKAAGHAKGVVVLKGGEDSPIPGHSSDNDMAFRQESFFMWAFGVQEAGFFGAVDVASGKSILFIPKLPEEYVKWYGEIYPPAYFAKKYAVSETHFVDDIVAVLKALDAPVLINKGVNTDSDRTTNFADFEGIDTFTVDDTTLHPIITELRAIKTQKEQELLKWINWVSSKAHVDVMQSVKPKMGEHQAESLYKHFMFSKGGCRHCQYQQICATGVDNAVLHYPSNNKVMKDGTLALFDMGCEYSCYGSDITVTFPVNGKFTDEQKVIYNAVYAASMAVMEAMGPGVNWVDMHVLANRVTLEHLKEAGLVQGDIEKMMEVHLAAAFQPHGLGHLLGLDVHDVGGYPKGGPERPTAPGLRSLRTARDLLPGMFITVEPGCYFNTICLDKAFQNPDWKPFLNEELIREKYWNIGGVRIEENVMVTDTGCELYTIVPRTVDEVEKVLAGGEWNATERGTTKFSMTRKYK